MTSIQLYYCLAALLTCSVCSAPLPRPLAVLRARADENYKRVPTNLNSNIHHKKWTVATRPPLPTAREGTDRQVQPPSTPISSSADLIHRTAAFPGFDNLPVDPKKVAAVRKASLSKHKNVVANKVPVKRLKPIWTVSKHTTDSAHSDWLRPDESLLNSLMESAV